MRKYAWLIILMGIVFLVRAGIDNPSPNSETIDGLTADQFLRSDEDDTAAGNMTFQKAVIAGSASPSANFTLAFGSYLGGAFTANSGVVMTNTGVGASIIGTYASHANSEYQITGTGNFLSVNDFSSVAGSAVMAMISGKSTFTSFDVPSTGSLNITNSGDNSIMLVDNAVGITVVNSGAGSITSTGSDTTNSHAHAIVLGNVGSSKGVGSIHTQGAIESVSTIKGKTPLTDYTDASVTLTTSDVRGTVGINADDDVVTFVLPDAEAGLTFSVANILYAKVITVDCQAGDAIVLNDGTHLAAGASVDSPGAITDKATFLATSSTNWVMWNIQGTWVATP